jgi:hypothetical protein
LPELKQSKELLQRSFQQRPGKPFHLDPLKRTKLLRGISVIMQHKKLPL